MRFNTGLESELMERAMPDVEEGKLFPEVDIESKEDSMDGKGSRSLSRPRWPSKGGGVSDLCNGEAVYE